MTGGWRLEARGQTRRVLSPTPSLQPSAIELPNTIVRCFLGDRDVVDMAFANAGIRDANERWTRAQLFDRAAAGIAHRCAQSAGELQQDRDHRALVRDASLDAFRYQLLQFRSRILKIAIFRAVSLCHCAKRTHAAI